MVKELEQAVLAFFAHVVRERDQLANDLTLSSPVRERHAVARDLAQTVVDTIAPPAEPAAEPAAEPGTGEVPPPAQ